jgi:hypothetical protein
MRRPEKRCDLGFGVEGGRTGAGCGRPEVNVLVVGTTPCSKEVELPRTPCEGLDKSCST